MKQLFIGLVVVIIAGLVYWLIGQSTAEAPGAQSATGDAAMYVGLSEGQAEEVAITNGVMFRVVERDGVMLPTTRDFREGRINAVVEDGVVTSFTVESNEGAMDTTEPATGTDGDESFEGEAEAGFDVDAEVGSVITSDHDAIIGMTVAEAEAYAEENELLFRIGSVDGEGQPVTMDYRPGRITAATEAGVVTRYTVEQ